MPYEYDQVALHAARRRPRLLLRPLAAETPAKAEHDGKNDVLL